MRFCFIFLTVLNLYIVVGLTLGHLFALGLCLARSYLRVKKDRVWWDDRVVLGAAVLDLIHMLTLWVKPMHRALSTLNRPRLLTSYQHML